MQAGSNCQKHVSLQKPINARMPTSNSAGDGIFNKTRESQLSKKFWDRRSEVEKIVRNVDYPVNIYLQYYEFEVLC